MRGVVLECLPHILELLRGGRDIPFVILREVANGLLFGLLDHQLVYVEVLDLLAGLFVAALVVFLGFLGF